MSTVRDLIKNSMKLIGVIGQGETPSSDDQADGLSSLNRMLDAWSVRGILVPSRVREEFALTTGDGSYTMGAGGDFDTSRPVKVERAGLVIPGTPAVEYPLDILNLDQWADTRTKSLQSTIPSAIYLEGTFPLETVNVWPVPSAAASLALYSSKTLTAYASVNVTLSLQPGYEDAMTNNLAIRLCPEYGKTASPELQAMAMESLEKIESLNLKPFYATCDAGVLQRGYGMYDITRGPGG